MCAFRKVTFFDFSSVLIFQSKQLYQSIDVLNLRTSILAYGNSRVCVQKSVAVVTMFLFESVCLKVEFVLFFCSCKSNMKVVKPSPVHNILSLAACLLL